MLSELDDDLLRIRTAGTQLARYAVLSRTEAGGLAVLHAHGLSRDDRRTVSPLLARAHAVSRAILSRKESSAIHGWSFVPVRRGGASWGCLATRTDVDTATVNAYVSALERALSPEIARATSRIAIPRPESTV